MTSKRIIAILSIFLSLTGFSQVNTRNKVSINAEMQIGNKTKNVEVVLKHVGRHSYLDFSRKGEFFQVKCSGISSAVLVKYNGLQEAGITTDTKIEETVSASIGFSHKGAYKASKEDQIVFVYIYNNGKPYLSMNFPETHDIMSQQIVFEKREVIFTSNQVETLQSNLASIESHPANFDIQVSK